MGRVQGGARAAFAKVCKMSVAGGCLQTLMTECSHGRVSVNSELGPRPQAFLFALKRVTWSDKPNLHLDKNTGLQVPVAFAGAVQELVATRKDDG